MNKVDPRKLFKRKLFSFYQGGNEIQRRKLIDEIASGMPLNEIELILTKQKPYYRDLKTLEDVYLT